MRQGIRRWMRSCRTRWWPRRGSTPSWEGQAPAAVPAGGTAPHAAAGEAPCACGWFDSSFELREGLAVIEHRELPLELAVQALLGLDPDASALRLSS